MTMIVCGLADLPRVISARRPSHLVTLLDPTTMIPTPEGVAADRHLQLGVNDINQPAEGMTAPQEGLVMRLLDFAASWDESAPMVVHCWAGVSRSTASAFTLACARSPETDEAAIARTLRSLAPHAYPNRRIVALADDMLGRGGRMVDAIEAIGGNGYVSLGAPFDFAARH
ncbi:MAG: hypothetical protein Q7V15_03940 [Phenylobacterium sp.]|uniref:tyrosine phosphatase family protein n=1 Tax=Phenylobacterium sp. TaxID=1871053 RepID=UPI002726D1D9|nr:protein-tyrosine phosphatase family protein [Phenylobacterium sp.]MDO8900485.1 hypothetical protein [Phenylobacterium sp.]MDP2213777.1 hypothetical protein [Phenylobacterium sp.]